MSRFLGSPLLNLGTGFVCSVLLPQDSAVDLMLGLHAAHLAAARNINSDPQPTTSSTAPKAFGPFLSALPPLGAVRSLFSYPREYLPLLQHPAAVSEHPPASQLPAELVAVQSWALLLLLSLLFGHTCLVSATADTPHTLWDVVPLHQCTGGPHRHPAERTGGCLGEAQVPDRGGQHQPLLG